MISWDDSYSVGVAVLDDQHKQMFSMINKFYSSLKEEESQKNLKTLLDGLLDYAKFHFETEENLMREHLFADIAHISQHKEFAEKAEDWQKRFKEGKLLISLEITNYIRDWLIEHIQKKDKLLGDFLKTKKSFLY